MNAISVLEAVAAETAALETSKARAIADYLGPLALPRLGELPGELPGEFEVHVTTDDIRFGIRESGNQCPIAQAIRRELRASGVPVWNLDVLHETVRVWTGAGRGYESYWHNAPDFIESFDDKCHVAPRAVKLRRWVLP